MTDFEKFNSEFPNSLYRLIHKQYDGDITSEEGLRKYQGRKAPINSMMYKFEEISKELETTHKENRVGWEIPDGYIAVDIDDKESAAKVFSILSKRNIKFSYMTGLHGGHFIFKDIPDTYQASGNTCALGIKVDTRVANKGYIILPINDSDRHWGTISGDVDNLPFWLKPIKLFKSVCNLMDLDVGSGRNDALLKHFLSLLDYATTLSTEEKVETIKLINNFVFKTPLSEKELESTVLRESLIEEHDKKEREAKSCLEEKIANKILEKYNIINVANKFYIYNGKYYRPIYETQEIERLIHFEYSESLKEHTRLEIIKFLALKSWKSVKEVNKEWNEIVFKNGIYNISTDELMPHDARKFNTIYIDHNYYPNAEYSSAIDGFFNSICSTEIDKKSLLYEIVGYCLLRKNIFSKFFVCYGGGGTGKSTYLKLIEQLIGSENASFLSLKDLETQYMPAELFGKLINLGDDISARAIKETPVLKKATTGEVITAQVKYQSPIVFSNYAKLIFSCNSMPEIYDKTTGLYRRMVLINIDTPIKNPDAFFMDKLTEFDYEYLLSVAVKHIKEALKRNKLTSCLSSEMALSDYRKTQSSILSFIEDHSITNLSLHGRGCVETYEEYKAYCMASGFMAYKKPKFENDICKELDLTKRRVQGIHEGESQQWRFVARCLMK